VASRLVSERRSRPSATLVDALATATTDVVGRTLPYSEAELQHILSPTHFIDVRQTLGGPSPVCTTDALREATDQLTADRAWTTRRRERLDDARHALRSAVEAL
jgi:hypothetical protein